MKNIVSKTVLLTLGVAFGVATLTGGTPARAQDTPQPPANTRTNTKQKYLETVLVSMSRSLGVTILADSSVAREMVTPPTEETTKENFAAQIETMLKELPRGTSWAKLYLPAPTGSKGYNADSVAEYALAQAKLFGNVGAETPAGTIEVLGQKVGADKSESVTVALNLKPVYLISNPRARANPEGNFAAMSADQQQEYAQREAQKIMNLDPAARAEYLRKMMNQPSPERAVMGALFQNMSPEQRREFFQGMGGGNGGPGGGGFPGGRGGGNRGGGNRGGGNGGGN